MIYNQQKITNSLQEEAPLQSICLPTLCAPNGFYEIPVNKLNMIVSFCRLICVVCETAPDVAVADFLVD